jgi:hypothetical protein
MHTDLLREMPTRKWQPHGCTEEKDESRKLNPKDNTMRMSLIILLFLVMLGIADPLAAAPLSGRVYREGVPTGNLVITAKGMNIIQETRTDAKGRYKFDLPPGGYILIIQGRQFPPVAVSPKGTRKDVRF